MTGYQWREGEPFLGVKRIWYTQGAMFHMEIQVTSAGSVIGSAWKTVGGDYWNDAEVVNVFEEEYHSVTRAKTELERYDREMDEEDMRWQQKCAAELEEYHARQAAQQGES